MAENDAPKCCNHGVVCRYPGALRYSIECPCNNETLPGKIGLLDGDDPQHGKEIRIHGNFTEHVPFALILMILVELNDAEPELMHTMGIVCGCVSVPRPWLWGFHGAVGR